MPPLSEYVYGAVPVTGMTVMIPFPPAWQDEFIVLKKKAMSVPDVIMTVLVPVQFEASLIVITCVPGARPVSMLPD